MKSPRTKVGGKVELLIVQRELCEPEEGLPDGVWETLEGFHINEDECQAVIAGARAQQRYLDTSDDQVFRIVKIAGVITRIDKPKEEE